MGWFGGRKGTADAASSVVDRSGDAASGDSGVAHLKELFNKYDLDGNGAISKDELRLALKDARLPSYHADEIFDIADANKDGEIDFGEFSSYVKSKEETLRRTFDKFDVSRTGTISEGDMLNVLEHMGLHPTTSDLKNLMSAFGRSGGGGSSAPKESCEVSYQEFRDAFALLNPVDFSKLADEWMHYSGEHASTGGGTTTEKSSSSWHSAAAGGLGAAISRTAVAPLERIRMQMIA